MRVRPVRAFDATGYWSRLDAATAHLDPVFATLDLDALSYNVFDMVRRAAGKPIRIATKSVRCRAAVEAALEVPGYRGVLAYTLAEGLWLAGSIEDVVVGYPSADREAYLALGRSARLAPRVTVMVDSVAHLDFIDAAIAPKAREPIRVCIELDSSWKSTLLGHVGVWRSPVHTPVQARDLARAIAARPGFRLVGMMGYEAQVAGLGNAPAGKPLLGMMVRWIQRASMAELRRRRSAAVRAVAEVAELEFVNGGGTGSLEETAADDSVTELAAGSGLFGPHLFDNYRHFTPAPAAAFALPVVRKPAPGHATLLGGGWIASGPPGADRVPQIVWPQGLRMLKREMAGEVQTPVVGRAARDLKVGDRVWARHTKAGELSEHTNVFHVVDGDAVTATVPTYRGEGKAFL
jgi:D-serine deaminase-like pyridoxal phosphate-dependent protein